MGVGNRAGALLAVALLVPLVVLGLADLVVTAVVESRLSGALTDALGVDADVELGPWPATPRLLGGNLSVDVEISPAGDDLEARAGRTLHVTLSGVELAEDRQSFTAEDADFELTLPGGQVAFGASTATGTATGVHAAFGERSSTITAQQLALQAGEHASATASQVQAELQHQADELQRSEVTAAIATLTASEDLGGGRLPLDVDGFDVRLEDLQLGHGGDAPTTLRSERALLEAAGLPLEDSGVRLDAMDASIPGLAITHPRGAAQLVVTSDGATFTAELGEQDLADLVPGPGQVELADDAVRVRVGPIAVEVDVEAEGRQLVLTPQLPQALAALLGEVPAVRVAPQLPEGVTLSDVAVTPDGVLLTGGGDRIVLPLR